MANSISALDTILQPGYYGNLQNGHPTVTLQEITGLFLTQLSAFPNQKAAFHAYLTDTFHCGLPQAGKISEGKQASAVAADANCFAARLDPAKTMLITKTEPDNLVDAFYPLDLTDARTILKIEGGNAASLLARLCAIDVSQTAFPEGSFAMTAMHHVSVSLWRYQTAFMVFLPRSFAVSLYHLIFEISEQFGCQVKDKVAF